MDCAEKKMRKKKSAKHPNPMFEDWLIQWRDEAEAKGSNARFTYAKALKSLKQYPLSLKSGKDCMMLQHFGSKICLMLDQKLKEHIAIHGTESIEASVDVNMNISPVKTKLANRNSYKRETIQSETIAHCGSLDPVNHNDEVVVQPQRKRRKSSGNKGPREYIPAYRSGAYAILLTLYRNMQEADTRGIMTKDQLIRAARPLADKSFAVPDPGCRYTSWSSMGSLTKKGLVIKEGSPAKYSLTDAGSELAHRLESVEGNEPSGNAVVAPRDLLQAHVTHAMSESEDEVTRIPPFSILKTHSLSDSDGESIPALQHSRLQYWYVTDDGHLVTRKDQAAVLIDDALSIGFLIKCKYQSLTQSGKMYKLDITKLMSNYVFAYLRDVDADDIASPPTEVKTAKKMLLNSKLQATNTAVETSNVTSQVNVLHDRPKNTLRCTSTLDTQLNPASISSNSLPERLLGNTDPTFLLNPTSKSSFKTASASKASSLPSRSSPSKSKPSFSTIENRWSSCPNENRNPASLPDINLSSLSSSQTSSLASAVSCRSLPPPDFVLFPGMFDVVLCVDSREFYGGSKSQCKTLLPDLLKNGVECDLRELHIGDLLWVAQERVQPQPGQLKKPKGRELVLDYIIERKRMDDLVSSMIDGRFREQKFRLKRSGIPNAIYLIEDYGSMQHFSIAEDRIKQAIVNTQVIDGFTIKRTSGLTETVAYLTVMTRYLQSLYKNKTLQACVPEVLLQLEGSFHIDEDEKLLTTFQHLNHYSVKTKDLTVREMFGKMLCQLHGMSADKAKAITDKFPTPTSLFKAYNESITTKEKEGLLTHIKSGKYMRNLGLGLSRQIYELYSTNVPFT